jgi:FO synthase subunit 2
MRQAQWLLSCGANDFGGTLINESISTAAGATHGQLQSPAALRRAIRDAGRVPVQRTTRYGVVKAFAATAEAGEESPLDAIENPESAFGSYAELTRDERFRFRLPVAGAGDA